MRNLVFAGAAALALTATPAIADDHMDDGERVHVLSAEQQTDYDGWPEERRAAYDGWPYNVQEYYWTLTPTEVDGWWVLTDPQRVRVYEMTPEQRTLAWQQISTQMSATTSAPAESTPTATASSSTPATRFVRSEVTQTTPAGYQAADGGELPVCAEGQQDGCINSWEKNGTGNRPLEYWPGRPASEIDGPLPATKAEYDSTQKADDDSE